MNVGDYCYIKGKNRDYGIGKIVQLNSGYSSNGGELIDILFKHSKHAVPKKDVISSPQIIGLIEIGDYVNGLPVIRIYNENEKYDNSSYKFSMKVVEVRNDNYETIPFEDIFKNEEIKTVLTHEQMEAIQYRVEE